MLHSSDPGHGPKKEAEECMSMKYEATLKMN